MEPFENIFGIVMIAIGVFLTLFYGIYVKRRDVGPGADTPEKRICLYGAIGIGVAFVGVGTICLMYLP
jgi:hypothetical protein